MNKSDITSALKRNGFFFTDVETPGGTVRVTARGPKLPADPGNDGERDTVVRAVHEGETLERYECSTRSAGAGRYVELVEKYGGDTS
jgi:hypothetical protein